MWYEKWIGKAYADNYRCGEFFREIQREEFGRPLPDAASPSAMAKLWVKLGRQVSAPRDGDAVLMAGLTGLHVGVAVRRGGGLMVLHNSRRAGGVCLTDKHDLNRFQLKIKEVLTWNG